MEKRKFKGKDDKSSNKKAKLVYWNCNKPGHFKKDCCLHKVNKYGVGPSGSKDPEKQQAFYVHNNNVARWVDSGATSHVCKDLYWFKKFQPIEDGSIVKMGNVATEPIKGIGSILLTFTSGKCLCLNNVLYVPGIRKNLVSEIVLNNCGYKQVLESDKYILSRHGSFVGFGYICNGMIRFNISYPYSDNYVCMASSSTSNNFHKFELRHARLRNIYYKRLKDMSKMSLIHAFDMQNNEKCKTCMLTKITRQPFKDVVRESKVLDLIHSDLYDQGGIDYFGEVAKRQYGVSSSGNALSLAVGLNNPRVIDLIRWRSSRLSLTVSGMDPLLEGLSEPPIKYRCSASGYGQRICSFGSIRMIRVRIVCLVCYSMKVWFGIASTWTLCRGVRPMWT
uniref:CCHC-type domain-containing protein n=1 Tax=Lactuca sativa TaxID=4236 RepID=A0A9R1UJE4_LACSA|nr:hypothetical protein LSAT_V11C900492200 [Lactuca sativa]